MALCTREPLYESSRARCEKELANEVQLIIPDKAHRNVLLASECPGKRRLPGLLGEGITTSWIPTFRSFVKESIGLDFAFIILREVHSQRIDVELPDLDATLFRNVVVVECCEEPRHLPSGFQWVPIIDPCEGCLVNVTHSEDDARREIHRELHGIANDVSPSLRVPWAFRSWHEKTLLWARDAFARHGLHMIGPMDQIRAPAQSTVLKINTNRDSYYIKCSSSTSNDAGVTSVMSAFAPELVRKPLVVDVERRLMILKDHGEDFGGCTLSDESRLQLMKSLARLHKTSTFAFAELVDVGLPVYSPQWMLDNLDALLHAKELGLMQDSALWDSLQRIKNRVIESLESIVRWEMPMPIPNCLVHNDVFEGNLTRNADETDNDFCFFDFDSSFGGHPIFDVHWSNREIMEGYVEEMGITDRDGWYELSWTAYRVAPLLDAFRYIDRLRAAEEGGARNDELAWVMDRFRSLAIRFKR